MKSVVVFAAVMAFTAPVMAADQPGGRLSHLPAGTLLRLCQSPQTAKTCEAYISGVSDGNTLAVVAGGPAAARKVCIPQVDGKQLRGVVVAWLGKHPDRLSGDVGPATFDALAEAFPCSGTAKP